MKKFYRFSAAIVCFAFALFIGSGFFFDIFPAGMGFATDAEAQEVQALWDSMPMGEWPTDDQMNSIMSKYEPVEGWSNGVKTGTTQPTTEPTPQPSTQPTTEPTTSKPTETTEEPSEEPSEEVHEHNYLKEITKQPTCTEEGITTYTCDCGDTYTEPIPAKGHSKGSWEVTIEPTCTTEGHKELRCSICNELLEEETIPATGHTPGSWEVTKQPDWIHDGEQVKRCTTCNEILETQTLPANHTPLYVIAGCAIGVLFVIILAFVLKKRKSTETVAEKTETDSKKEDEKTEDTVKTKDTE